LYFFNNIDKLRNNVNDLNLKEEYFSIDKFRTSYMTSLSNTKLVKLAVE
jgi:hypothetical protein